MKSDTIYHGKKRAKMVKLASISLKARVKIFGAGAGWGKTRVKIFRAGRGKGQKLQGGAKCEYLS